MVGAHSPGPHLGRERRPLARDRRVGVEALVQPGLDRALHPVLVLTRATLGEHARRVEGRRPVCHTEVALRDLKLAPGDTLLVKGRRKYLRNLNEDRANIVLVAEPDATPGVFFDRPRALGTIAITLAMLVVMAFAWLPNAVAVLLAAVTLVITQCVRPAEVYRSVNWESIVLIAGMIPLALALASRTAIGATSTAVAVFDSTRPSADVTPTHSARTTGEGSGYFNLINHA